MQTTNQENNKDGEKNISNQVIPIPLPSYSRDELKVRMAHLGFGAFHRAHQAFYTHALLSRPNDQNNWGYLEVSFSKDKLDFFNKLRQQNHLYTLAKMGANGRELEIIGSIKECSHPLLDGVDGLINKLASPDISLISLTITEKGYCLDGNGMLDLNNPLISHDIKHPSNPKSALGYLVATLAKRQKLKRPPISILSCDNLSSNGALTKKALMQLAQNDALANYIDNNVSFPNCMVDRIVPALSAKSLDEIKELLGVFDPCAVICEPFIQWVIEDDFKNNRPNWDEVGATFVTNVIPFEEMKLRMLNGAHSFLAYLGYLGGYKYIGETMEDPNYKKAALNLMRREQAPTLNVHANLEEYASALIERFSNPALKHETYQIAMDGSKKLPQRMLNSVLIHIKRGTEYKHLALGIAGWMRYVYGVDEDGNSYEVQDPMNDQFKEIYKKCGLNINVVRELINLPIFGEELSKNEGFIKTIEQQFENILKYGAKDSIKLLGS